MNFKSEKINVYLLNLAALPL